MAILLKNSQHQMIESQSLYKQSGFSMIEILISMLIFAIGGLVIAGIMALTLSNNTQSGDKEIASIQANNMANMIQSNQQYWVNGAGDSINETAPSAVETSCNNSSANCTPTEIANEDLSNWGYYLSKYLPNGTGNVTCTTQAPNQNTPAMTVCNITVYWSTSKINNSASTNDGVNSYTLVYQP